MSDFVLISALLFLMVVVFGIWSSTRGLCHVQPYAVKVTTEMFTNDCTQKELLRNGTNVF
jgi:hypothetical protein